MVFEAKMKDMKTMSFVGDQQITYKNMQCINCKSSKRHFDFSHGLQTHDVLISNSLRPKS